MKTQLELVEEFCEEVRARNTDPNMAVSQLKERRQFYARQLEAIERRGPCEWKTQGNPLSQDEALKEVRAIIVYIDTFTVAHYAGVFVA